MNREEAIELLEKIEADFVPCDEPDRSALKKVRDAKHELQSEVFTGDLKIAGSSSL